mmetsp:Transcript_20774/g.79613  ORF Transcript_20774/g.79613 Transcript_20774/m.79613 type:complete len:485 (+) Transcript_20774:1124-2578(+)
MRFSGACPRTGTTGRSATRTSPGPPRSCGPGSGRRDHDGAGARYAAGGSLAGLGQLRNRLPVRLGGDGAVAGHGGRPVRCRDSAGHARASDLCGQVVEARRAGLGVVRAGLRAADPAIGCDAVAGLDERRAGSPDRGWRRHRALDRTAWGRVARAGAGADPGCVPARPAGRIAPVRRLPVGECAGAALRAGRRGGPSAICAGSAAVLARSQRVQPRKAHVHRAGGRAARVPGGGLPPVRIGRAPPAGRRRRLRFGGCRADRRGLPAASPGAGAAGHGRTGRPDRRETGDPVCAGARRRWAVARVADAAARRTLDGSAGIRCSDRAGHGQRDGSRGAGRARHKPSRLVACSAGRGRPAGRSRAGHRGDHGVGERGLPRQCRLVVRAAAARGDASSGPGRPGDGIWVGRVGCCLPCRMDGLDQGRRRHGVAARRTWCVGHRGPDLRDGWAQVNRRQWASALRRPPRAAPAPRAAAVEPARGGPRGP